MPSYYDAVIESAHKLPLSASLPKVLRLAESTGDKDFATWVRLELLGYVDSNPVMTEKTMVPKYRSVWGQWFDSYGRGLVFEDPKLGFINEVPLRPGVAELESFVGATGVIAIQIPALSDILRENLGVEVTTFRFSPTAIRQVLANIKAQMLERLATRQNLVEQTPAILAPQKDEILELKPNLYGIGVNLKALWRRWSWYFGRSP